jgi:hypothetical protein
LFGFTNADTSGATNTYTSANASALDPFQVVVISIAELDHTIDTGSQPLSGTFLIPLANGLAGLNCFIPPRKMIERTAISNAAIFTVKLMDTVKKYI